MVELIKVAYIKVGSSFRLSAVVKLAAGGLMLWLTRCTGFVTVLLQPY